MVQTYSYCTQSEMRKHICFLNISEFAFQLQLKTPCMSVTICINIHPICTRKTCNKVKHKKYRKSYTLARLIQVLQQWQSTTPPLQMSTQMPCHGWSKPSTFTSQGKESRLKIFYLGYCNCIETKILTFFRT